jgi:hypothetical protein
MTRPSPFGDGCVTLVTGPTIAPFGQTGSMTEPDLPIEPAAPDPAAHGTDAVGSPEEDPQSEPGRAARMAAPARRAIRSVATGVVSGIGQAVDGVERSIAERPGARVRRVRRRAAEPLPFLNDVHPEVRLARPVQVGLRTIPVDEIAGTAVGGGDQRAGDFLPLKAFRGKNWAARWARLRRSQDRLAVLPPIDVFKHGGRYWVVDGHNRVGLALYAGQPDIDAEIIELVAPGERRSEPILTLAPTVAGSVALRTAATGHRPSEALTHEDVLTSDPERTLEADPDVAIAERSPDEQEDGPETGPSDP